jgi:predicted aspartyl protease
MIARLVRGELVVLLPALVAMLLLSACDDIARPSRVSAPADTAGGGVPLQYVGQGEAALVVPVHINGEGPFQLILDTGATMTCVDTALANRLRLPARRGAIGSAVGVGVGGAGQVGIVGMDSIRVGNASAHDIAACTMDLRTLHMIGPQLHGLLGLNFLRGFKATLDFEHNVLYLTSSEN